MQTYLMVDGSFLPLIIEPSTYLSFFTELNLVCTWEYEGWVGFISHHGQSVSNIRRFIGNSDTVFKLSSVRNELQDIKIQQLKVQAALKVTMHKHNSNNWCTQMMIAGIIKIKIHFK